MRMSADFLTALAAKLQQFLYAYGDPQHSHLLSDKCSVSTEAFPFAFLGYAPPGSFACLAQFPLTKPPPPNRTQCTSLSGKNIRTPIAFPSHFVFANGAN